MPGVQTPDSQENHKDTVLWHEGMPALISGKNFMNNTKPEGSLPSTSLSLSTTDGEKGTFPEIECFCSRKER